MSTTIFKQITWEQWEEEYIPIYSPPYFARLYETFGDDLEYVKNYPHKDRIWTLMDDGGITNGMHLVNRQGYYITEKSWAPNETIETIDDEEEYEPEGGDEYEYDDDDDGTEDGIFK